MIRKAVLAIGTALAIGFAVWIVLDPDVTGPLATIAGLFTGMIALLLSLTEFLRREPGRPDPATVADDLGLRLYDEWSEEATARQLRDPRVLPLTWKSTTRNIVDDLRSSNSPVVRIRLDGRLDGRFDEATGRLAEGWARVPNGRLVIIGEPGSGKTVLAMLLTLGLLSIREPGGCVPVLLPVSSWDPVREHLDDWIVRTLAQPYYNGRPEIPRTLLTHGLLLPILDGLDEIPESARRSAIRRINHAIGGERPVVVTCRATEYEDLIRSGAPMLRQAAVVEISPVLADDVIAYLAEVRWPAHVDWAPVFTHLRERRQGAVAAALSTPLMVTSARLVYERGCGRPQELLEADRFDSMHAVEDHVFHRLIDAAYAPDPNLPDEMTAPVPWSPAQARRWLTFLASYLHDRRERDLAWWLMSGRLLSAWAGPVTGLGGGILLVLAAVTWMSMTDSIALKDRGVAVVVALIVGGVFALLHSLVWYVSEARPPGRLTWPARGSAKRLARGFRIGLVLALVSVVPLMFGWTAIRVIDKPGDQRTPVATALYVEALTVSVALAAVVGCALAAHNWLDAPPSRATQVSPTNSLRQDRRSSIVSAMTAGLVTALLGLPAWWVGTVAGELLLGLLTGETGWPGRSDVGLVAADRWSTLTGAFGNSGSVVGVALLLPGVFFSLIVLMGRAWPRFVVARFYLAVRGKLPWRLMTFLADARRRELLRQAGGVYQFRHIRLQETLAVQPTYGDDARAGETAQRALRRRVVLVAGTGLAAAWTARLLSRRRDGSVARLAVPGRRKVVGVAMRPGAGREVAFALEDGSVWRWGGYAASRSVSLATGYEYAEPDEPMPVLAFSADGDLLMATRGTGGGVSIWNLASGGMKQVGFPSDTSTTDSLLVVHGDHMAWSDSSHVGVWKAIREDHPSLFARWEFDNIGKAGDANLAGMAFLRDGSLVLMGDAGGTWRSPAPGFHDLKRDLPSLHLNSEAVFDSENGATLLISRYDDSLAVFGPEGAELWRAHGAGWDSTPQTLGAALRTGAFHPKRPLLAVAESYGGDIQLWHLDDTPRPRQGEKLIGHNDSALFLDFSSDGHWLATGAADGTLRIWDATIL
ncbi:NACHT domain-containing protein [Streptomyces pseudovenezuelae]|uniref:NACHT and WD40 repeat domain-containing protein n=1 Tax=Streptomyces pseudovenezuelae TaxID=67350 RepID=UPI0036E05D68